MEGPRAVRIPKPPRTGSTGSSQGLPRPSVAAPALHRPNGAGSRRSIRITLVFLLGLALLFLGFVLYDRSAPGGRTPLVENLLLLFAGVAAVIGALGAGVALSPAPRWVELTPDRLVVCGRWGQRTVWPPAEQLTVRVVRHYPAGGLGRDAVESVVVSTTGRRARTYLVEEGLFAPPHPPEP